MEEKAIDKLLEVLKDEEPDQTSENALWFVALLKMSDKIKDKEIKKSIYNAFYKTLVKKKLEEVDDVPDETRSREPVDYTVHYTQPQSTSTHITNCGKKDCEDEEVAGFLAGVAFASILGFGFILFILILLANCAS